MTEGPEATYLASYIHKHYLKKRLHGVKILGGRYKTHEPPAGLKEFSKALPMRLTEVHKKGKVILLVFEKNWCLLAKMGMVGWFSKPEDGLLFSSDPNVSFAFDGQELGFYDFRNFGTLTFTQDAEFIRDEFSRIAPDILNSDVSFSDVYARISELKVNKTLDIALMDQTLLVSGIGNIIKSEALYHAKLSPKRPIQSLTKDEWRTLFGSLRMTAKRVLRRREKAGLDFEGYFDSHAIYQKPVDPKGNPVERYKSKDGRTTFWVPAIQK